MKKTQLEAFTLDRIATPVGEVLLVTDAEGPCALSTSPTMRRG
ncbi:hypothetical protein V8F63_07105 [Brevundimonas sp. LF-1]